MHAGRRKPCLIFSIVKMWGFTVGFELRFFVPNWRFWPRLVLCRLWGALLSIIYERGVIVFAINLVSRKKLIVVEAGLHRLVSS